MNLISNFLSLFFTGYSFMFFASNGCDVYASNALHDEIQHYDYMSDSEESAAYNFYYDACTSAGGAQKIADPVFL